MAHQQQIDFCQKVKSIFPSHFTKINALDCGSYDINGNNRVLFFEGDYTGLDVVNGPNVDVVSPIHEYKVGDNIFDTIISTECFEHDKYFKESIARIVEMLKPDGLFVFTCATGVRQEHGTKEHLPDNSPTVSIPGWETHYRNIEPAEALEIGLNHFKFFSVEVDQTHGDLYFWGKDKKTVDFSLLTV